MRLALDPPPVADSPIGRLDPRWKLAGLGLAGAAAAAVQSLAPALAALTVASILAVAARLPARWLLIRLSAVALVLLPFVLILSFFQGAAGARFASLVAAKATTVVLFSLVALGSTPLPVALHATRSLGVPGTLVHVVMLSYRYLFLLADELDRLRRAIRVRGFRPRTDRHTYRTAGHLIGTLVVRGTERAEGVSHAMRCRGFDGRFRSLATFHTTAVDVAFFATLVTIAAAIIVCDVFRV